MSENNGVRVVTGKVRLSFPHLFEPHAMSEDQEKKYSVMLLIPKTDKATVEKLRNAEKAAIEQGKAGVFKGKLPRDLALILKDGDEDGAAEDYPERAGHLYMTVSAKTQYRPGVVDRSLQPILDQSEVYSGVYARASVTAFPYTFGSKKGISFGLNNVQILGGGESLAGGLRAEDEFDDLSDDDLL